MLRAFRFVLAAALAALAAAAAPPAGALENEPGISLAKLRLHRSFGRHGVARVTEHELEFNHVAVDSQGRIYIAGEVDLASSANGPAPGVVRYLPDGTRDASFSWGGPDELFRGRIFDLVVDAQDRVVICGDLEGPRRPRISAIRILSDGEEDTDFAEEGTSGGWSAIRLQQDGVSLFAIARGGSTVVKLGAAGAFDASFAGDGEFTPEPRATTDVVRFTGIAPDSAGGVVAATTEETFRLLPDGTRDASFGAGGRLAGPEGGDIHAVALERDAQGRLVVRARVGDNQRISLYRFLADGSPDLSFSGDGRADEFLGYPGIAGAKTVPDGFAFAVSPGPADAVLYAAGLGFANHDDRGLPGGEWVQAVSMASPGAVASYVARVGSAKRRPRPFLRDVAFAPDGMSAYAVGDSIELVAHDVFRTRRRLIRVALEPLGAVPLPDLRIVWEEQPAILPVPGNVIHGSVRVTNEGQARSGRGHVKLFFTEQTEHAPGDDGVSAFHLNAPRLAPGRSAVVEVNVSVATESSAVLRTKRIAAFLGTTMQTDITDDVAVSDLVR